MGISPGAAASAGAAAGIGAEGVTDSAMVITECACGRGRPAKTRRRDGSGRTGAVDCTKVCVRREVDGAEIGVEKAVLGITQIQFKPTQLSIITVRGASEKAATVTMTIEVASKSVQKKHLSLALVNDTLYSAKEHMI